MNTLVNEIQALSVSFSDTHFIVALSDGRFLSVPIHWYPRLAYGTSSERSHYKLLDGAIHWPELDEDIALEALLQGAASHESAKSLERFYRWMQARRSGATNAPFALALDYPEAVQP